MPACCRWKQYVPSPFHNWFPFPFVKHLNPATHTLPPFFVQVRDLFVYISQNNKENSQYNRKPSQQSTSVKVEDTGTQTSTPGAQSTACFEHQNSGFTICGPFPTNPRTGPRLYRCERFKRTGKHLGVSRKYQHSTCFQVTMCLCVRWTDWLSLSLSLYMVWRTLDWGHSRVMGCYMRSVYTV